MRTIVGVVLTVFGVALAGAAVGQVDPIKARQALMASNGDASKVAFDMVRGTTAFDAAAASAAMLTIAGNMATFPTLFPEGSDQGNTKASPAIWQNTDAFNALAAKLAADATAAAASVNTVEDLQAAFPTIGGDCGACHQKFRL